MRKIILVFVIGFISTFAFAQCESDATLQETQDWLKTKIELFGGGAISGSKYTVEFNNSSMIIKEIDSETKALANTFTIDFVGLNVDNITHKTNMVGTLKLTLKGSVSLTNSIVTDLKGEIVLDFTPDANSDFVNRLTKALKHAKCLWIQSKNTTKEKF